MPSRICSACVHPESPSHLPVIRTSYWTIALILWACSTLSAQNFVPVSFGEIALDTTNTNGASWVDFDNDGDLDLFLSNANVPLGFNILYRNDGKDRFVKVRNGEVPNIQSPSFGNAWADYDNDGLIDLFVVNAFSSLGSLMYRNLGDGQFQRNERYDIGRNAIKGFNAAWGDYDNDGLIDLIITHPAKFVGLPITSNFLFHNEGSGGHFTQVTTTPITRSPAPFTNATWSDHDLDGDLDLFIGSGPANGTTAPDYLYKNLLTETGRASFERITETAFAKDSLDGQVWNWVDYDNDGDLDAFVTNWGGPLGGLPNNLYRNDSDSNVARYTRITDGAIVTDKAISLANVWGDFDNDGDLDVFVGNDGGQGQKNHYYRNNGDGSFTSVQEGHFVQDSRNSWGVCAGDYDNDGDLDLFVANKQGYVRGAGDINFLYRNDLNNGYNWLLITCVGQQSNRSAIGTKIWVTAEVQGKLITQFREVGCMATFLGQNDLRAHFGLEHARTVTTLRIKWPSGQIESYQNVEPNKTYVATEGKDLVSSD